VEWPEEEVVADFVVAEECFVVIEVDFAEAEVVFEAEVEEEEEDSEAEGGEVDVERAEWCNAGRKTPTQSLSTPLNISMRTTSTDQNVFDFTAIQTRHGKKSSHFRRESGTGPTRRPKRHSGKCQVN